LLGIGRLFFTFVGKYFKKSLLGGIFYEIGWIQRNESKT
jgi:hypothetical protein